MKEYLIYFAQAHPNFRIAELESLAHMHNIKVDFSHHDETKPFLVVQLDNDNDAKLIMERSVLSKAIYEIWGYGETYDKLHEDIKSKSLDKAKKYEKNSFKFDFVSYMGGREDQNRFEVIESFAYLALKGPIRMKNPDEIFTVIEEFQAFHNIRGTIPQRLWFGRQIELSARSKNALDKYNLKKRKYIGTTSFDAELAMVSCNITQVNNGKIVYDPFSGTGSFLVAASTYGGISFGSDIDVRMVKGKKNNCNIYANFKQYGIHSKYIDVVAMDFTNNALRDDFLIDTIVCDPPYGVREGLKVCGVKDAAKAENQENIMIEGEKAHLRRDYIPPKKAYELSDLLDDLLNFAANRLPVNGRIGFWMPTANDNYEINQIPQHANLELLYNLQQDFNEWSRRLLVYVKRDESYKGITSNGLKTNNITSFRNRYFTGFNLNGNGNGK